MCSLGTVLRIDPKDEDALQAKLFLLLQTEHYSAALTILEGLGGSDAHSYEKAYTLYRLQRESDAAELLPQLKVSDGSTGLSRGIAHLEAQIVSVTLTMKAIDH
jgi:signal recognition particle subunit SRP72